MEVGYLLRKPSSRVAAGFAIEEAGASPGEAGGFKTIWLRNLAKRRLWQDCEVFRFVVFGRVSSRRNRVFLFNGAGVYF